MSEFRHWVSTAAPGARYLISGVDNPAQVNRAVRLSLVVLEVSSGGSLVAVRLDHFIGEST